MDNSSTYRPDIDGLRAVAVLAVVIFHAFPHALPGGFVGVDIFFVISGYLITGLLISDQQQGRYSIVNFYSKRIRRIFPALLVVMSTCIALGWWVLTAEEYEQLGKHIAGGAAFLANFIFYKEAGYFDNSADTKPMLHLWSLGVEEQFYIVWPLLLPFLLKQKSSRLRWGLFLILIALSFVYSALTLNTKPSLAFYSPLSRFWELATGAGLALALRQRNVQWSDLGPKTLQIAEAILNALKQLPCSTAGFLMILIPVALYSEKTPFPAAAALLPVLGTLLIIATGPQSKFNRLVLGNRPMVAIGLISYPIYLWHWPLLSFLRIMESQTPSASLKISMIMLTFGLAWATYRFIEQPIRHRAKASWSIPMLVIMMLLVFSTALFIKKKDGLAFRLHGILNADPTTLDLGKRAVAFERECGLSDADKTRFQYCLRTPGAAPTIALFGDSKAEALLYGVLAEAPARQHWMLIGSVGAPTTLGTTEYGSQQEKSVIARDLVASAAQIQTVVLAVALRSIFSTDHETGFPNQPSQFAVRVADYSNLIQLFRLSGKQVVFFMDNPTFPDPKSCISGGMTQSETLNRLLRRAPNPRCEIRISDYQQGAALYIRFVETLKTRFPDMRVIDPLPQLCDVSEDVCRVTDQGSFLYSYGDHLSFVASRRIAKAYFSLY